MNRLEEQVAAAGADLKRTILGIPRWRLYLYVGIAALGLGYLGWSWWSQPRVGNGQMQTAASAIPGAKVTAAAPKVIRVIDKQVVYKYLSTAQIAPAEQAIDSVSIPAAPNGATTITTIDQNTGEARTQYQLNEAPWFALEKNNEIGVQYGLSANGNQTAGVHYRRDFFRVKDVHVSGQIEVNTDIGGSKTDTRAVLQANWRF